MVAVESVSSYNFNLHVTQSPDSLCFDLIMSYQSGLSTRSLKSYLRNFKMFLFVVPQNKKLAPLQSAQIA